MAPSAAKKRKNNKKKRPIENVAPLYKEDIGTEGVKPIGVMVPQHTLQSFRLKVDAIEKSKRQKRMVSRKSCK
jgi:uncharacterized protein YbaA (DUF1428 family)